MNKSLWKKILSGLLIAIASIFAIILLWIGICNFNRKNPLSAMPQDFSIYLKTDSIWDTIDPLLDLKATDIFLSDPAFGSLRESVIKFKNSSLRNNKLLKKLLARRVDFCLYKDNNFIASLDTGILSSVTRLLPIIHKFVNIPNLSYTTTEKNSYFTYTTPKSVFYIKTYKNLIVACQNKDLFLQAISFQNKQMHEANVLNFLKSKSKDAIYLFADGQKLIQDQLLKEDDEESNVYYRLIMNALAQNELSVIKINLTETDFNVQLNFPLADLQENDNPAMKIIKTDSTVPELLTKLPSRIQYYTFINAGSIKQLKEAAFSLVPKNKNLDSLWQKADFSSQLVFNLTLEQLLYSWTDDEFAVFGLEGKAEPVFAIKIKDELQRQYVFDNMLSSVILKNDRSLLIDGVRLPCIEVPDFLQSILRLFDINIPRPYYYVKGDYIYFSQSPENLTIISQAGKSQKLSQSENWVKVSNLQNDESTVSLFYNLSRSIPFFLKSKSTIANILKLYNIGRVDLTTENKSLTIQLQAVAGQESYTQNIPGFPINNNGNVEPKIFRSPNPKQNTVFYMESKNTLKALNCNSLKLSQIEIQNLEWIVPNTNYDKGGIIWAITKYGTIYLLDENLNIIENFPLETYIEPSSNPFMYNKNLVLVNDENLFYFVDVDAGSSAQITGLEETILSAPAVSEKKVALYQKGFIGQLDYTTNLTDPSAYKSYQVEGIGYGSPCILTKSGKTYIAFITQAGTLIVLDENMTEIPGFPLELEGVFRLNVTTADSYIFALNTEGVLYRISLDGEILQIQIPYFSAKSGFISVFNYNNDKDSELFICGEGNKIYGFRTNLEMLPEFPIAGYGIPCFIDINADKKLECLTLATDNKLYAYNMNTFGDQK